MLQTKKEINFQEILYLTLKQPYLKNRKKDTFFLRIQITKINERLFSKYESIDCILPLTLYQELTVKILCGLIHKLYSQPYLLPPPTNCFLILKSNVSEQKWWHFFNSFHQKHRGSKNAHPPRSNSVMEILLNTYSWSQHWAHPMQISSPFPVK